MKEEGANGNGSIHEYEYEYEYEYDFQKSNKSKSCFSGHPTKTPLQSKNLLQKTSILNPTILSLPHHRQKLLPHRLSL
jgi:hypothetical protein